MVKPQRTTVIRTLKLKRGGGLVNTLINKLPFEAHLPGYQYCGPGTKLRERLVRGDQGINPLDEACREHDIAYSESQSLADRHKADEILENRAWNRVKAKDAKFGEKTAAWFVTNTMKSKRKLGMGMKKKINKIKIGGKLKKFKKSKKRIIRTPKQGGFLPLLFPALAALGALAGGGSAIASAVNKAKNEKAQLEELKRHNLALEAKGKGLYLKPYKGYGLYLTYPKNSR